MAYKGHIGYIRLKYLDRVNPVKAYITENATVYKDAGATKKLGSVAAGATVYVVGVDGSYVRIRNKSGAQVGYIKASVLSTGKVDGDSSESGDVGGGDAAAEAVPESLRSTTSSASGSKVEYTIYVAQNLMGTPYSTSANPAQDLRLREVLPLLLRQGRGLHRELVLRAGLRRQLRQDRL